MCEPLAVVMIVEMLQLDGYGWVLSSLWGPRLKEFI